MRYVACTLICLFLFAFQQNVGHANESSADKIILSTIKDKKRIPINDEYAVLFYKGTDAEGVIWSIYEILQGNKTVYSSGSQECNLSGDNLEGDVIFPPPGKDITGEGIPNLVVGCITGGSHCCTDVNIFSLGEEFKSIKDFHFGYSTFKLTDLDGDDVLELTMDDWTFQGWSNAEWFGANEGMANQKVILRYKKGDYHIAPDLMQRFAKDIDPPSERQIAEEFSKGANYNFLHPEYGVPFSLWGYMLSMVYNGQGNEALFFCSKVWPKNRRGEKEFVEAFKKQLIKSPYWPGIKVLNGW